MSLKEQDRETAQESMTPDFLKEMGISPEEQQEMEAAAYNGAADDIAEKSGLTGGDLKAAEEAAGARTPGAGTNTGEGGWTVNTDDEPPTKRKGKFTKKKGLLATMLGGGGLGIFGIMMLGAGPLQLAQLGNILGTDGRNSERSSNVRANAMYRYARTGDYGQTRISYYQSKGLAKTTAALKTGGITVNKHPTLGTAKSLTIDTNSTSMKGSGLNGTRDTVAKQFGVPPESVKVTRGGFATIDFKGQKVGVVRNALKTSVKLKYPNQPFRNWLRGRAITANAGYPSMWSPMKRLTSKVDRKVDGIIKRRAETKAAKEAAKERKVKKFAATRAKIAGLKKSLNSKIGGKAGAGIGGALLIQAAVCEVRSAAAEAAELNRQAVVLPAAMNAVDAMAVGSQATSGLNFDAEQLGGEAALLSSAGGATVWQSLPLMSKTDPNAKGKELRGDYAQSFSDESSASKWADFGGGAGEFACRPEIKALGLAVGLVTLIAAVPTGGATAVAWQSAKLAGSAAIGIAAFAGLRELVKSNLMEDAISENISAETKGSLLAYGSREFSNMAARGSGGIELSKEESAAIDRQQQVDSQVEFANKPMLAKLFDGEDHRSIAGKLIQKQSTDPGQNLQNMATGLLSLPTKVGSMFGAFMPKVKAADAKPYDYGFNRYGIPDRILYNPAYEDPYENASIINALLDSGGDSYKDKAMTCFGVELSSTANGWAAIAKKDIDPKSTEYENANCDDAGDPNWDRMILFVNDDRDMQAMACMGDSEEACSDLGVDSSTGDSAGFSASTGSEFTIATYNALGASHTGGEYKGRADISVNLIKSNKIDIAGMQEFTPPQRDYFIQKLGSWDAYPKGNSKSQNSIIWNASRFTLVKGGTQPNLVYFCGAKLKAPYVRLKDNNTQQELFVLNTHDPANVGGCASSSPKYRFDNANAHVEFLKELSKQGLPIFFTGDFNSGYENRGSGSNYPYQMKDENLTYCILNRSKLLLDAYDVYNKRAFKCPNSKPRSERGEDSGGVDHVFVSPGVEVSAYKRAQRGKTHNGSDHPTHIYRVKIPGAGGSGSGIPGSAVIKDDYKEECATLKARTSGLACNSQCVDFVKFRLKKNIDIKKFASLGNGKDVAANLGKNYGYKVDKIPAVHSVVSWPAGGVPGSGANSTYGHTAIVAKVNKDGSIVVEQYNAGKFSATIPANAAKQLTYAHTEVDYK